MKRRSNRRPGKVVVAVAVSLVTLLGAVALSLEGGMMMDNRRQVQSAADAAALAATDQLYVDWWTGKGLDVGSKAYNSAVATAARAGYVNGQDGCTVTVNIPPASGPFTNKAGHAEVLISIQQKRYFSRVWGTDNVPIGTRAVSRGRRGQIKEAILVLAPDGKAALSAGGGANISVTGAPIHVNSNNAEAMVANGGGTMKADPFEVVGAPGYSTPGGGSFTGPIVSNAEPLPDPLADLPPPDPSTMIVRKTNKLNVAGNGADVVTLKPGVYIGGISITGQVNVVLEPGIYYMQGGGFSWGGGGSLTGTGVMIYNAPTSNSDAISLQGNGTCNLSPMMSGPYQGILLFQDRTSTTPVNIAGNGGMALSGTFYAASATLNVTGNGTQDVIGSQYISRYLVTGGNGSFSVNWTPDLTPGTRDILLVE